MSNNNGSTPQPTYPGNPDAEPVECPFVDRSFTPNPEFNKPHTYTTPSGYHYVYYDHFDGIDIRYPCQFCKLIGRKRDVFECLNENEWHSCPHYLLNAHRLHLHDAVVEEEA